MKNNAPKRKVFQDAVDLISPMEEMTTTVSNGYEMISLKKIVPFHNHPFRLYDGERLNDMVENVREHGILTPVIVQKTDTGYEMVAGHNRMNAAKIVGIDEIPAIVKEGLTEKEAYVYVIETNMLQRSFSELSVSEKAAVLAERYDKVLSQGKRNDIINELTELDGTCGHGVHKSRDDIGEDYGMSGRSASRLMRVNHLVPELSDTSKIENAVVEMINLEEEIKEDVKELVELKRQIKRTICQLSDPEQQCLLEKRYLLQETWERIADDLDISTRIVFRIHDEALKNIMISESWQ